MLSILEHPAQGAEALAQKATVNEINAFSRKLEQKADHLEALRHDTNRLVATIIELESQLFTTRAEKLKMLALLKEADNTLQELGISTSDNSVRDRISSVLLAQNFRKAPRTN